VVKIYNESINTVGDSEDCLFSKASLNLQVSYFKEALFLIDEFLPQGMMHYFTELLLYCHQL
jgi:endoribonuclease Dicer